MKHSPSNQRPVTDGSPKTNSKKFNLISNYNLIQNNQQFVAIETLKSSEKSLDLAGIELESPRLAVHSADHSATRPEIFQKSLN